MNDAEGANALVNVITAHFEFLRLIGIPPPEHVPPHEIALIGLVSLLVTLTIGRLLTESGFTLSEVVLVVVAAPLFTRADVSLMDAGPTSLAFNFAGFFIPVAITAKILFEGRARPGATLFVIAVCTVAAYMNSYAVPDRGVMLYYRVPAILTAVAALVVSWGRIAEAARLAFMGGAWGVIIGADAFRIHALFDPASPPHRVVVGGAGILDGIFLVGILATLITVAVGTLKQGFDSLAKDPKGPPKAVTPAKPRMDARRGTP